jgi:hypothetical protein
METNEGFRSNTLHKIISLRNINNVVPVISNSFHIEQVFRTEKHLLNGIPQEEDLTLNERLTKKWAEEIQFPLEDGHEIWRVAQYYQVEHDGSDVAKEEYLEFLKKLLLKANEQKEGYEDFVRERKRDAHTKPFSEIVKGLDYPLIPDGASNPLDTVAEIPFPVYITTSYHDFLERAIKRVSNDKRQPRTQVVFWEPGREYDDAVAAGHYPDPSFNPTPEEPAVYHLFGLEDYPGSLVLGEDDYMKFLVSVVADTDTQRPMVPPRLRRALASAHLLLMGSYLRDWDFRVLFRFILNYRQSELLKQSICIQVKPKREDQQLLDYLKRYFNMKKFDIEWCNSEEFIQNLGEIWKGQQPT